MFKIPDVGEMSGRLDKLEADMSSMRADLTEIRRLLDLLITVQYNLAGLDRPTSPEYS